MHRIHIDTDSPMIMTRAARRLDCWQCLRPSSSSKSSTVPTSVDGRSCLVFEDKPYLIRAQVFLVFLSVHGVCCHPDVQQPRNASPEQVQSSVEASWVRSTLASAMKFSSDESRQEIFSLCRVVLSTKLGPALIVLLVYMDCYLWPVPSPLQVSGSGGAH